MTTAATALLAGCAAGSVLTFLVEALSGAVRVTDLLWFDAIIVVFATGAWCVSVLPLAIGGSHRGWFFHPIPAPAIGAVCGAALLLLEVWLFFGESPGLLFDGRETGETYLITVAAIIGATIWLVYTRRVRRLDTVPSPPD